MLNVPTVLPFSPAMLGDTGLLVGEHADAPAMQRRGQLHVEALLQRLQPAQRHADARVCLAARKQLQQLIAGSRKVDPFDLEIVPREVAVQIGSRNSSVADRIRVPAEPDFARRGPGSNCLRCRTTDRGTAQRIERWMTGRCARRPAPSPRAERRGPPQSIQGMHDARDSLSGERDGSCPW